jgi:ribonucleoside-diphosphate reductase beta chain
VVETRRYLEHVADLRLLRLGLPRRFGPFGPSGFKVPRNVSEPANPKKCTVAQIHLGMDATVAFEEDL